MKLEKFSSWFSTFMRSKRHRGEDEACILCKLPLVPEDRFSRSGGGHNLKLQHPSAPMGLGSIHLSFFWRAGIYTGKGDAFDSKLQFCQMCVYQDMKLRAEEGIAACRRNRAREVYDKELEAEILCDAWGVTPEQFRDVALKRGDLSEEAL